MITKLERYARQLAIEKFPYTNVIGIGRTLLALGTLLTLCLNDVSILMPIADEKILNPLLNPLAPINHYNFFLLLGTAQVAVMKLIAVLLLISVIIGYFPQITCFFHWWISVSFLLFSSAVDGGDQITANLTLLLIPLCLTDPRRNHWTTLAPSQRSWNLIGIMTVWLIRLQVAAIYFHAAVGKLEVEEWVNGTALYYWFYHSAFGMPAWLEVIMQPLLANFYFIAIATLGVILLELILLLALTMPIRNRLLLLPIALSFHFMIILFHGIFSFFFAIAAGLVLYLYPVNKGVNIRVPILFKIIKNKRIAYEPHSNHAVPAYAGEPVSID